MNATFLALGLIAQPNMQTVYLQRIYPVGVKDTYSVTLQIDNNAPLRGRIIATTSQNDPRTRELTFVDEKTVRSGSPSRDQMVALFSQNGMFASGDFESPKPVYAAFALASFVPVGSIAVDGSAGTTFDNPRLKFMAMTHVENSTNARLFANLESVATIEPKGGISMSATINNTIELATGRMDKAHIELRRSADSRLVADFQLIDSKAG